MHVQVPAVRVDTLETLQASPGMWSFEGSTPPRGIMYACPCGCGEIGYVQFRTAETPPEDRHHWVWDQNPDEPTLTPSIRHTHGCRWHGHLTKGQWVPVGDSGV